MVWRRLPLSWWEVGRLDQLGAARAGGDQSAQPLPVLSQRAPGVAAALVRRKLGQLLLDVGQNAPGLDAVSGFGQPQGGRGVRAASGLGPGRRITLGGHVDHLAVLRAAHEHVGLDVVGRDLDAASGEVARGGHRHAPRIDQLDLFAARLSASGARNRNTPAERGTDGLAEKQLGGRLVGVAVRVGEGGGRRAGQHGDRDDDPNSAPEHREKGGAVPSRRSLAWPLLYSPEGTSAQAITRSHPQKHLIRRKINL